MPLSSYITADIYIPEKNLVICIDGPCHFYNRGSETEPFLRIEKLNDRLLLLHNVRVLRINSTDGKFFGWMLNKDI